MNFVDEIYLEVQSSVKMEVRISEETVCGYELSLQDYQEDMETTELSAHR